MAELAVGGIEALGDDEADARGPLGVDRGLPGAPDAVALARDHHAEAAAAHEAFMDGEPPAAQKAEVGEILKPLAEVVAHPAWGDLVHGHVIPQRHSFQGEVLPLELVIEAGRVFAEQKHPTKGLAGIRHHVTSLPQIPGL